MSQLPAGWLTASLGDLQVEARSGFPSGKHNSEVRGVAHLRPMNISREGSVDLHAVKYVESPRDQRVRQGDVLFNNTNSPALVGKTAYFGHQGDWAYSNHMTRLRAPAGLDARYLAIQLHYLWRCGAFLRLCSNHVNQASISSKTLLQAVRIVVPPTAEQKRIVAAIDEQVPRLDAGVAALERVRQNLKRMRAAVLQAAVTGRLAGTSTQAALDSHSEWDVVTVGDIAEVSGGITKNPNRLPRANPIPFLRVANVQRDALDLNDVHEVEVFEGELDKLRLRHDDLLVVEGNGSPDQIGRSALWDGSIDPCVHQNHLIRIRPGVRVLPAYLNLFWNAPSSIATIRAIASSTSGLYTLSTGKVRSIPVVLPPTAAQEQIVAEVERQLPFVEALDHELVKACVLGRSLRSSVLSAAFSGRLTTQDPNDEPASILFERITAEGASSNGHKPAKDRSRRRRMATA